MPQINHRTGRLPGPTALDLTCVLPRDLCACPLGFFTNMPVFRIGEVFSIFRVKKAKAGFMQCCEADESCAAAEVMDIAARRMHVPCLPLGAGEFFVQLIAKLRKPKQRLCCPQQAEELSKHGLINHTGRQGRLHSLPLMVAPHSGWRFRSGVLVHWIRSHRKLGPVPQIQSARYFTSHENTRMKTETL